MLQLHTLMNLRPETVVSLLDVPFTIKVQALPNVVEASYSIDSVEMVGNDDEMIDVSEVIDASFDCEEIMVVLTDFIVCGGLNYDQHAESPFEDGCANGSFCSLSADSYGFYQSLGRNADGDRDLQLDAVTDELAKYVAQAISPEVVSLLADQLQVSGIDSPDRVLPLLDGAIRWRNWDDALDRIADAFFQQRWWSDMSEEWVDKLSQLSDMLDAGSAESAWDRAFAAGKIGNPMHVAIDELKHSSTVFQLAGKDFDPFSIDALWIPDDEATANIQDNVTYDLGLNAVDLLSAGWNWHDAVARRVAVSGRTFDQNDLNLLLIDQAQKYAKPIIEDYEAYVNGEVYFSRVYVIDRKTGELLPDMEEGYSTCYGREYAEEMLQSEILSTVALLSNRQ